MVPGYSRQVSEKRIRLVSAGAGSLAAVCEFSFTGEYGHSGKVGPSPPGNRSGAGVSVRASLANECCCCVATVPSELPAQTPCPSRGRLIGEVIFGRSPRRLANAILTTKCQIPRDSLSHGSRQVGLRWSWHVIAPRTHASVRGAARKATMVRKGSLKQPTRGLQYAKVSHPGFLRRTMFLSRREFGCAWVQ